MSWLEKSLRIGASLTAVSYTHLVPQRVLIEVNVSGEETKGGFSPDELRRSMDGLQNLCGIRIEGLMTMAPRGDKSRDVYKRQSK